MMWLQWTVVCFILIHLSQSATVEDCRASDGEVSCYELIQKELNFDASKAACEEKGMHLAVITSSKEQNFVMQFIRSQTTLRDVWIGLVKTLSSPDSIKWVDGTPIKYNDNAYYQTWHYYIVRGKKRYEPNESSARCIRIHGDSEQGSWADRSCSKSFWAICEKNAPDRCPTWNSKRPRPTVCFYFNSIDGLDLNEYVEWVDTPNGKGLWIKTELEEVYLGNMTEVSCIMNPGNCSEGVSLSMTLKLNAIGVVLSTGLWNTQHVVIFFNGEKLLHSTIGDGTTVTTISTEIPKDNSEDDTVQRIKEWFRYTLVIPKGNNLQAYIDGNPTESTTDQLSSPLPENTQGRFKLGRQVAPMPSANFVIDDLIIYDEVLNPEQIRRRP